MSEQFSIEGRYTFIKIPSTGPQLMGFHHARPTVCWWAVASSGERRRSARSLPKDIFFFTGRTH